MGKVQKILFYLMPLTDFLVYGHENLPERAMVAFDCLSSADFISNMHVWSFSFLSMFLIKFDKVITSKVDLWWLL